MDWRSFLKPEEKARLAELQERRTADLKEIRRIKDRVRLRAKRQEMKNGDN